MLKNKNITNEDILTILCSSVANVLSNVTVTKIGYSPMVQKINRTCLRPDIGCFVLFDGGFAGLVIINFSAAAAMEIYRAYMKHMNFPEHELAQQHTSDDVGNILGELMNQIVGDFIGNIGKRLFISLQQNQPKMLTINKEVMVSIDTNLDRPQARRVSFNTANSNVFYLELVMDRTELIQLYEFEHDEFNPDDIIKQHEAKKETVLVESKWTDSNADLLDELGI